MTLHPPADEFDTIVAAKEPIPGIALEERG